jgi:hypothetical protein
MRAMSRRALGETINPLKAGQSGSMSPRSQELVALPSSTSSSSTGGVFANPLAGMFGGAHGRKLTSAPSDQADETAGGFMPVMVRNPVGAKLAAAAPAPATAAASGRPPVHTGPASAAAVASSVASAAPVAVVVGSFGSTAGSLPRGSAGSFAAPIAAEEHLDAPPEVVVTSPVGSLGSTGIFGSLGKTSKLGLVEEF